MKYYDKINSRLVYVDARPTAQFWDNHWEHSNSYAIFQSPPRHRIIKHITKKYLRPGSIILEGGSGLGDKVYRLQEVGYEVIGIDFAKSTLLDVKRHWHHLNLFAGDVARLPLRDRCCDGYWSLGVIEHFREGFSLVMGEIFRVLRPGGFLFLAFPHMGLVRRAKAFLRLYPTFTENSSAQKEFYQYALSTRSVVKDLELLGFQVLERNSRDTLLEMNDEIPPLRPILNLIQKSFPKGTMALGVGLDVITCGHSGHSCLLVCQKT